jgi:DNA-binding SARP family transcriptional activator
MHSMRLQTLLAYLVLNRGSQVSRQYLSFCFWPDSSESNARSNLRQQLHKLRKILPDHDTYLQIENQTVSWNPEVPVSLDIAEFEQAVNESKNSAEDDSKQFNVASLENAVEIYRGDLFPECYEEWIEPARSQFREDYMAILDTLVEHFESHRVHGKAIYYAEKLLDCDKLREKTHLDLMRLHALSRERANSLKVYRNYVELLDQELGIEPGSDIKQLHRQLVENDQIAGYGSGNGKTEEEDLLPMIGRQKEWVRLRETWKNVLGGESHFVIISGEAGIGKTRLARELYQTVSRQNYITTSAHCYEAEGSLSYSPVNEWLSSENIKHRLKELDKVYLREITRLLPELLSEIPALSPPAPITDKWQQHHFFESLARSVILPQKPMLMLIDDLQWCDRETLEWIHFLLRFALDQPLLVVGTVRVEEVDEAHPLRLIVKSLHKTDRVTEINLQPLSPYETGMLAEQVYGDDMTEALRNQLFRETEGNPLFLVT